MAYDKAVDSGALETKLTAIADAIRGKTGGTDALTLEQMAMEIAGIQAVGGGNANTFSGDLIIEADTTVYGEGLTFNLGLPSRVKWFVMWLDREDFLAIESPVNNHWFCFYMIPIDINELPPIRYNNTTASGSTGDRMFWVITTVNACSESENGCGLSAPGVVSHNHDKWATSAKDDGTITVYRFNTSASYFYAGTYHWIAVC